MQRVVESLNAGLHNAFQGDPRVVLIGEDVSDPYGGAFKVTRDLSSHHPDRVFNTPISEAAITGVGIGLAIAGYRPIVEIMFGDFVTLIADQIINQASKYAGLLSSGAPLPLVIRTPMGGRRGYGPTHSQTLERLFFAVPYIEVIAVSNVFDPGRLVETCVTATNHPVVFVENKALYGAFVLGEEELNARGLSVRPWRNEPAPTLILGGSDEPDVTLATYGGMVPLVLEAADRLLKQEELVSEIVVYHKVAPIDFAPLRDSVARTRRAVVVEEGVRAWGWGSELAALLTELALDAPVERVGTDARLIPASRSLEDSVLPQIDDIIAAAIRTVDRTLS